MQFKTDFLSFNNQQSAYNGGALSSGQRRVPARGLRGNRPAAACLHLLGNWNLLAKYLPAPQRTVSQEKQSTLSILLLMLLNFWIKSRQWPCLRVTTGKLCFSVHLMGCNDHKMHTYGCLRCRTPDWETRTATKGITGAATEVWIWTVD